MTPTPALAANLKIGLLGGSFNPAHGGHREISLAALSHLQLDQVWWLVTPGNPQKDPDHYADYDNRLARAAEVATHPRLKVSNYEKVHDLIYTADTVTHLKRRYETTRFVWLMGADSLAGFHTWQHWHSIMQTLPIAIFNRPGDRLAALKAPAARAYQHARLPLRDCAVLADQTAPKWLFVPDTINRLSATTLRKKAAKQHKTLKNQS